MNVSLTDILSKYPRLTDKHRAPRSVHSYGPLYDLVFSSQIEILKRPLSVMEIGTKWGGSAISFLHLDQSCLEKFVCLDRADKLQEQCREIMDGDERCEFELVDAYSDEAINMLKEKHGLFDIIIDDGPHTLPSQQFFFKKYYELLNDHGVLVCEDIKVCHMNELKKLRNELGIYFLNLLDNTNRNKENHDEIVALRYKK